MALWRSYVSAVAALATFAAIIAMACDVTADEPTQVRITVARSVSGIPPRVTQSGETRALAEDPRIRQVYMGI